MSMTDHPSQVSRLNQIKTKFCAICLYYIEGYKDWPAYYFQFTATECLVIHVVEAMTKRLISLNRESHRFNGIIGFSVVDF